jgi:hypothetical protein
VEMESYNIMVFDHLVGKSLIFGYSPAEMYTPHGLPHTVQICVTHYPAKY